VHDAKENHEKKIRQRKMLGARSAQKKVLSYTSYPQDFMQPFYGHTQQTKQKRDYLVVLELILDQSK